MKYRIVLITILTFMLVFQVNAQRNKKVTKTLKKEFVMGVNGHPLSNEKSYWNMPIQHQLDLVKELNFNYYRIDLSLNDTGLVINHKVRFDSLIVLAKNNKVKLLPLIILWKYNFNDDELGAYNKGYKAGFGFAKEYNKVFPVVELENELDIPLLKDRKLKGESIDDYNPTKAGVTIAFLKGMNAGVKAASPTTKTCINFCETHYGYMQLLKNADVNFDIIGSHWYDRVQYKLSEYPSVVKNVASIFNNKKKIWVNEYNYFLGGVRTTEDVQDNYLQDFVSNLKKEPSVTGCFFYELLDQPYLNTAKETFFERNFGIIKWDTASKTPVHSYKKITSTFR